MDQSVTQLIDSDKRFWIFHKALGAADEIVEKGNDKSRNVREQLRALCAIASAQALVGDIDAAMRTAELIHDASDRDPALRTIAECQAKTANFNTSISTARRIHYTAQRVAALTAIADAQRIGGDLVGARITINEALHAIKPRKVLWLFKITAIPDAMDRGHAKRYIAAAQAKIGDIPGALRTAQEIDYPTERALALSAVAETRTKGGDQIAAKSTFADAVRAISDIETGTAKINALCGIAEAQVTAGDRDAGIETASSALASARVITDVTYRSWALRDLALLWVKLEHITNAIATAKEINQPGDRVLPLLALAAAQTASNPAAATTSLIEAFNTARKIDNPHFKAEALAAVARAQTMACSLGVASTTIAEALSTAEGIQEPLDRAFALPAVVVMCCTGKRWFRSV